MKKPMFIRVKAGNEAQQKKGSYCLINIASINKVEDLILGRSQITFFNGETIQIDDEDMMNFNKLMDDHNLLYKPQAEL